MKLSLSALLSFAPTPALATSLLLIATPSTAQAAQYYNCANATGCQLVSSNKANNDYTATQYPVVMAHGLGGWTKLFGLIDYWYGIPETLMKGGTEVYTPRPRLFMIVSIGESSCCRKSKPLLL